MRHLAENFRKAFKSTELLRMLWKAAYETINDSRFYVVIGEIHSLNSSSVNWLMSTVDPSYWATCKFLRKIFGHSTSNIVESINAWLLEAKVMPILGMVKLISQMMMSTWFYKRRVNGECID